MDKHTKLAFLLGVLVLLTGVSILSVPTSATDAPLDPAYYGKRCSDVPGSTIAGCQDYCRWQGTVRDWHNNDLFACFDGINNPLL